MARDWMKHIEWSQQESTSRPQSDTTGYKTYPEDIELPVRRKQALKETQAEVVHVEDSLDSSDHGTVLQPRKITKSFKLATRPFGVNLTITETTKCHPTPVYFAVSSEVNPKQPDIVLYAGESKNGDRLAVAYYRFSRHVRMGFGSETLTSGEGVWEQMNNTSSYLGHYRYEFEYSTHEDDFDWDIGPDAGRTRKKFVWERTRDEIDGVKGVVEQHAGWRNYKLVDLSSGKVLAVMLASMFTGCSFKGVLNLHEELSKEMEQVVVMTAVCIFDKGERRIRHYAFGGGGGGP